MNVTATVGGNVLGDQEEKEKSMKIKKSTKALAAAASLAMMVTVGLSACGGSSNDAKTTADGKVISRCFSTHKQKYDVARLL
jgi:hypothetical protein